MEVIMEPSPFIKTEEDIYHTEAHAVQEFIPVPQTDEYLKSELVMDWENLIDNTNDSEANCKELVLLDDPPNRAGILDNESGTGELSFNSDTLQEMPSLKCEFCMRTFKKNCGLQMHLRIHTKQRKTAFTCDSCDRTFWKASSLNNHKRVHVINDKMFKCEVCGCSFAHKRFLTDHMRRKHLDKLQSSTSQMTGQTNKQVGSKKTELISDEEFIDEENDSDSVSYAQGSHHPALAVEDDEKTSVGISEQSVNYKVYQKTYPRETHVRSTHSDQTYKCQFCTRVFSYESSYKKHLRKHLDNRKRYACEQCGSKFFRKEDLKRHINQHDKNRKREFNCELCGKMFYTKTCYQRHMWDHMGKTVSCGVCGKHFTRSSGLKRHMQQKHTNKTRSFTPDPQTANDNSLQIKEELVSGEEFLDEEII